MHQHGIGSTETQWSLFFYGLICAIPADSVVFKPIRLHGRGDDHQAMGVREVRPAGDQRYPFIFRGHDPAGVA